MPLETLAEVCDQAVGLLEAKASAGRLIKGVGAPNAGPLSRCDKRQVVLLVTISGKAELGHKLPKTPRMTDTAEKRFWRHRDIILICLELETTQFLRRRIAS